MLDAHVSLGEEVTLRLKHALLIYESEGYGTTRQYIEARPILHGPEGPQYGAGVPADARQLRRILQRDAGKLVLLPDRLLAVAEGEVAWWTPPGRRTPIFLTTGELAAHSGRSVMMPALLFHVRGRALRVRALAGGSRPRADDPLYVAPVWNVYRNGSLCMGSMPLPRGRPADRIEAWETAFWDSAFTVAHDPRVSGHPRGYAAMLKALRTRARFPDRWLVPSGETVETWLNGK